MEKGRREDENKRGGGKIGRMVAFLSLRPFLQ
jgi:hypothetical protein